MTDNVTMQQMLY